MEEVKQDKSTRADKIHDCINECVFLMHQGVSPVHHKRRHNEISERLEIARAEPTHTRERHHLLYASRKRTGIKFSMCGIDSQSRGRIESEVRKDPCHHPGAAPFHFNEQRSGFVDRKSLDHQSRRTECGRHSRKPVHARILSHRVLLDKPPDDCNDPVGALLIHFHALDQTSLEAHASNRAAVWN